MVLALLLSMLASQTAYEWTDKQGESHFTDDPSTIPKGAKRRVVDMDPQDAPVVKVTSEPVDAGARALDDGAPPVAKSKPVELPSCAMAQRKVADLELKQEQARAQAQEATTRREQLCQARLRTHGRAAYATCLVQEEKAVADFTPQIEAAREALRRLQQSGCR